ncbi:CalY family protein [Virgibacillus soli]|uniref:CalY family protein n=1 Tax=Paracerasibacillus soli TaxID=480284 RepID=UPI0035E80EB0
MSTNKKFGLSIASAALGLTLISGGTFAYFSDTAVAQNTFTAGTLDLSLNPEVLIDISNMKPGDNMLREFDLTNEGTLKIQSVLLETDYRIIDLEGNNVDDFGKHIQVNFLWNWNQESEPIFETTLYELKNMDPDVVKRDVWDPLWEQKGGLDVGENHEFWVEFSFIDNGEDQNMFQGDSLLLEWKFHATQTSGEDL